MGGITEMKKQPAAMFIVDPRKERNTLSDTKNKPAFFSPAALKKFFSPPLAGFIVGIILVLLDCRLPSFLMNIKRTKLSLPDRICLILRKS